MKYSPQESKQINLPLDFPFWWCSDYGEDEYGIFMGFKFEGIRQGFRWIPSGTFIMGSPEKEPGRRHDETQHQVTLTKGFWMAETTCTQALWQAVMKNNPSFFKGDDLPVEQVSWDDAQKFIRTLNAWQPELALRLPSEAEWEYACRAGTTTPFHFGTSITTDQVNYVGSFPPDGLPKGGYRMETVAVKAMPVNDWGLYQMHGNVREWCADWQSNFTAEAQRDPSGPARGRNRVLRGGSWISLGRGCRSADRNGFTPSYRVHSTGFRLARGQ